MTRQQLFSFLAHLLPPLPPYQDSAHKHFFLLASNNPFSSPVHFLPVPLSFPVILSVKPAALASSLPLDLLNHAPKTDRWRVGDSCASMSVCMSVIKIYQRCVSLTFHHRQESSPNYLSVTSYYHTTVADLFMLDVGRRRLGGAHELRLRVCHSEK